jgi:hypothetical protein
VGGGGYAEICFSGVGTFCDFPRPSLVRIPSYLMPLNFVAPMGIPWNSWQWFYWRGERGGGTVTSQADCNEVVKDKEKEGWENVKEQQVCMAVNSSMTSYSFLKNYHASKKWPSILKSISDLCSGLSSGSHPSKFTKQLFDWLNSITIILPVQSANSMCEVYADTGWYYTHTHTCD